MIDVGQLGRFHQGSFEAPDFKCSPWQPWLLGDFWRGNFWAPRGGVFFQVNFALSRRKSDCKLLFWEGWDKKATTNRGGENVFAFCVLRKEMRKSRALRILSSLGVEKKQQTQKLASVGIWSGPDSWRYPLTNKEKIKYINIHNNKYNKRCILEQETRKLIDNFYADIANSQKNAKSGIKTEYQEMQLWRKCFFFFLIFPWGRRVTESKLFSQRQDKKDQNCRV